MASIDRTPCTAGTKIKSPLAIALGLFLGQYFGAAAAQTVNWINDSSGSWTTGTNWSTGTPPGPGASVVIDRGAANPTVTLQGTAQVNRIQSTEAFSIGAPASDIGG